MTAYSEIYERFLSRITDSLWARSTDPSVVTTDLHELMIISMESIRHWPSSFDSMDDTLEEFTDTLTSQMIQLISSYMLYNWVQRQLNTWENLQLKTLDSDFQYKAQSSHISAMRAWILRLQRMVNSEQDRFNRYPNHKVFPYSGWA